MENYNRLIEFLKECPNKLEFYTELKTDLKLLNSSELREKIKTDLPYILPGVLLLSTSEDTSVIHEIVPVFSLICDIVSKDSCVKNEPWWKEMENNVIPKKFFSGLTALVEKNSEYWAEIWIFAVTIMVNHFHLQGNTVNSLLKIMEVAFKKSVSDKGTVLENAFDCWDRFIQIFTSNPRIIHTKKLVGLLVRPLTIPLESRLHIKIVKMYKTLFEVFGKSEEKDVLLDVLNTFIEYAYKKGENSFSTALPNECCELLLDFTNNFVTNRKFYILPVLSHYSVIVKSKPLEHLLVDLWTKILDGNDAINIHDYELYLEELLLQCQKIQSMITNNQLEGYGKLNDYLTSHTFPSISPETLDTLLTSNAVSPKVLADMLENSNFRKNCMINYFNHYIKDVSLDLEKRHSSNSTQMKAWDSFCEALIMFIDSKEYNFQQTDSVIFKSLLLFPLQTYSNWAGVTQRTWHSIADSIEKIGFLKDIIPDIINTVNLNLDSNKINTSAVIDIITHLVNIDKNAIIVPTINKVLTKLPKGDPKSAIELLTFIETLIGHEDKKQYLSEVLSELLRICTYCDQLHEHRIRTKVSKLYRKLITDSKSSNTPSPKLRSPPILLNGSSFLSRSAKANSNIQNGTSHMKNSPSPILNKRSAISYFEDDSQEFVIVPPKRKSVTPLTEHQKEKMLEKRSDIPALYQDLSQDTQSISNCSLLVRGSGSTDSEVVTPENKILPKSECDSVDKQQTKKKHDDSKESIDLIDGTPPNESVLLLNTPTKGPPSLSANKKLNFENLMKIDTITDEGKSNKNEASHSSPVTPRRFSVRNRKGKYGVNKLVMPEKVCSDHKTIDTSLGASSSKTEYEICKKLGKTKEVKSEVKSDSKESDHIGNKTEVENNKVETEKKVDNKVVPAEDRITVLESLEERNKPKTKAKDLINSTTSETSTLPVQEENNIAQQKNNEPEIVAEEKIIKESTEQNMSITPKKEEEISEQKTPDAASNDTNSTSTQKTPDAASNDTSTSTQKKKKRPRKVHPSPYSPKLTRSKKLSLQSKEKSPKSPMKIRAPKPNTECFSSDSNDSLGGITPLDNNQKVNNEKKVVINEKSSSQAQEKKSAEKEKCVDLNGTLEKTSELKVEKERSLLKQEEKLQVAINVDNSEQVINRKRKYQLSPSENNQQADNETTRISTGSKRGRKRRPSGIFRPLLTVSPKLVSTNLEHWLYKKDGSKSHSEEIDLKKTDEQPSKDGEIITVGENKPEVLDNQTNSVAADDEKDKLEMKETVISKSVEQNPQEICKEGVSEDIVSSPVHTDEERGKSQGENESAAMEIDYAGNVNEKCNKESVEILPQKPDVAETIVEVEADKLEDPSKELDNNCIQTDVNLPTEPVVSKENDNCVVFNGETDIFTLENKQSEIQVNITKENKGEENLMGDDRVEVVINEMLTEESTLATGGDITAKDLEKTERDTAIVVDIQKEECVSAPAESEQETTQVNDIVNDKSDDGNLVFDGGVSKDDNNTDDVSQVETDLSTKETCNILQEEIIPSSQTTQPPALTAADIMFGSIYTNREIPKKRGARFIHTTEKEDGDISVEGLLKRKNLRLRRPHLDDLNCLGSGGGRSKHMLQLAQRGRSTHLTSPRMMKLNMNGIFHSPNWPTGPKEDWVAVRPTTPVQCTSRGILKNSPTVGSPPKNIVTVGSPPAKKKKVSFMDPPVSQGLLYLKGSSEGVGQLQYAGVSPGGDDKWSSRTYENDEDQRQHSNIEIEISSVESMEINDVDNENNVEEGDEVEEEEDIDDNDDDEDDVDDKLKDDNEEEEEEEQPVIEINITTDDGSLKIGEDNHDHHHMDEDVAAAGGDEVVVVGDLDNKLQQKNNIEIVEEEESVEEIQGQQQQRLVIVDVSSDESVQQQLQQQDEVTVFEEELVVDEEEQVQDGTTEIPTKELLKRIMNKQLFIENLASAFNESINNGSEWNSWFLRLHTALSNQLKK